MDDISACGPANEAVGRARGGLFMGLFGGLWWFAGLQLQHTAALWPYALNGLLTLALAGACMRLRQQAAAQAVADPAASRRIGRAFLWINVTQWGSIFVVTQALTALHLAAWIYPAVIAIVGLHFLPLARVFRYPPHLPTGIALLLWALIFPRLLKDAAGPLSAYGPFGAGTILWSATAWIIWHQRGWLRHRIGADRQPIRQV